MNSPHQSNPHSEPSWGAELRARVSEAKRSRKVFGTAFAVTVGALSLTVWTFLSPPRATVQTAMLSTSEPLFSGKGTGGAGQGVGLGKWLGTNVFVELRQDGKAALLSNGTLVRTGDWAWAERSEKYSFSVNLKFGKILLEKGEAKLSGRFDVLLGLTDRQRQIDYSALNWAEARLELFAETVSGSAWEVAVYQFAENRPPRSK